MSKIRVMQGQIQALCESDKALARLHRPCKPARMEETQVETAPPQSTEELVLGLWSDVERFLSSLMRPWSGYQFLIALGLALVAYLLARFIGPHIHGWMRSKGHWATWRLRILVILHRRLQLIIFVALIWPTVWIMREVTWPSRSYMLSILAQLAFAWLIIAVLTRVIKNTLLRQVVRYCGWIWVTLSILNLTEDTRLLLDSAAINLGGTHLSLWLLLQAVASLTVLFTLARFLSRASSDSIRKNKEISPSMQVLMVKFLQVLLYGAAVFIGLQAVGFDLTGLAFLSGAIGVGLGFGLQKVVSNLVSGIIILMDKSIKPGDVISLGSTFGWIEALGARYVSVVTRDGKEFLIPNEDLITGQVVNWSHSNDYVRLDIEFGTAYGDDPHQVRAIAIEAALSVDRVLSFKPPVCHIIGFGDSSVDYVLRFWIKDPTGGLTNIRGNVFLALWDGFQKNGISIPFPQREVTMLPGSQLQTKPE